jgi:hypothetical protein
MHIVQEILHDLRAGVWWAPEPVYMGAKNVAPTVIRPSDRPVCTESQYGLRYLDCQIFRAALRCIVEKVCFNVCRTTLQTFFHNEIITIAAQNACERLHGCPYLGWTVEHGHKMSATRGAAEHHGTHINCSRRMPHNSIGR